MNITTGIFIVLGLFIIGYAFILFRLWKRSSKLKNSFFELQKGSNQLKANNLGQTMQIGFEDKLNKLERDLGQRIFDIEQELKRSKQIMVAQQDDMLKEEPNLNVIYLKEKNGEFLSHETLSANEGKFKLFIQGNKAMFEFSGQVVDFVSPDYFDKACEFINNPKNVNPIKYIKTVEKGDVELQSDGSWKVVKKARIKFE